MIKNKSKHELKAEAVEMALKEYKASRQNRDQKISNAMTENAVNVKRIAKKYGVSLNYLHIIYRDAEK
jgi:transposase-like protein